MTKTVTISAARANGDPYAHHDVIVTLIAGSAGGVVGSTVVVESSTVRLDANGEGSIPLATNDTGVESPTGSFYRFTVAGSSPTITRSIALTDDLPSTVSWTLAGIQVADPTDPQRDVSSDFVTIDGGSLTNYLAALGTGTGAIDVTLIIGTAAVDGTATSFAILGWDQNATASGLAPAQYVTQATVTDSELVGYLTGVLGFASTDDVTVLVPAGTHIGAWTFTPDTIGDPWTEVAGSLVVQASSDYLGALFKGSGSPLWLKVNDAGSITYEATGLLLGITEVHPALHGVEGILDRWSFNCGMSLTANVNTAATNPTLEYGGCVAGGRVFLNAQTTPSQNGHYYVNGDLTITRLNHPDVFDPPGNGYRATLVAPADPAHGLTLMWVGDDRTHYFRGGAQTQQGTPGDPGEWVTVFDPTATGGGVALGETSTTAYRGDRGKTAYDYSQAHTGATDPHGDRAYAAALVDDLSGVTDASTARTNLGLGTAATTAATAYDTAGSAATAQAAAIQRTNHTGTQAASTVTGLPWNDDVAIVHMVRDPLTSSGTAVGYIGGNMRGGGYVQSQLGSGWSWTFPRLPLRAGTYTLRSIRRTASDCGIATFTVGGTAAGTADGYSVGNVNDVSTDATTSLVIAADGFYDLVMTSTTKNASSTNYRTNAQITRLFRTGA